MYIISDLVSTTSMYTSSVLCCYIYYLILSKYSYSLYYIPSIIDQLWANVAFVSLKTCLWYIYISIVYLFFLNKTLHVKCSQHSNNFTLIIISTYKSVSIEFTTVSTRETHAHHHTWLRTLTTSFTLILVALITTIILGVTNECWRNTFPVLTLELTVWTCYLIWK
jgi:hypothetical protein